MSWFVLMGRKGSLRALQYYLSDLITREQVWALSYPLIVDKELVV